MRRNRIDAAAAIFFAAIFVAVLALGIYVAVDAALRSVN